MEVFQMNSKKIRKRNLKLNPNHVQKVPLFILFISALEVIVHYAADDGFKKVLLFNMEYKKEIWRFLTYMLLHTNPIHLGLNILIQGLLGIPLELEQGRLRCGVIYFSGGLAGSLGSFAFSPSSLMAGASGCIYALLTSQIPNVVLNYGTTKYALYRIVAITLLTASDVIYVFCHVYIYNNEKPRIGWVAHASGAAAGLLLGFILFKGNSEWKKTFRVISSIILVLSCISAVVLFLTPNSVRGRLL